MNANFKKGLCRFSGCLAAVGALGVNALFARFPLLAESLYFRAFFQVFRWLNDHSLSLFPLPLVYGLVAILIALVALSVGRLWRVSRHHWKQYMRSPWTYIRFVSALGWVIASFYVLWAFNYQRPSFESRHGLQPGTIALDTLIGEIRDVEDHLLQCRQRIHSDTSKALNEENVVEHLEKKVRHDLERLLQEMGYPTWGRVRVRHLRPKGTLLHISTAGVYIPFVSEGHIDAGLHPISWPFTMSHEMSHGYGFTDEGTCNFLGFLSCIQSDDAFIQYSGWMGYYRYLLSDLRRADRDVFLAIRKRMPRVVHRDLRAMDEYAQRYKDIFPKTRDAIYDQYLKSHGVKGGLRNYNRIVWLAQAWKRKFGSYAQ